MDNSPQASIRTLDIRFVGSGSEYFRIWIVNLLLTLVTLGLYYPFAKLRRLRYFHGCTELDGHPLEFHGNPWAMLRGYLLVLLLALVYGGAQYVSELAGAVALLLLAAIGPGLWWASLRFRLANTSWRGVRLRFAGSAADAYRALAPAYVLGLALVLLGLLSPRGGAGPRASGLLDLAALLLPLALLAALPWLLWRMRRYQHDHLAFATEQTTLRCGPKPVYGVFARASLLSVALLLAIALVFVGLAFAFGGRPPSLHAVGWSTFWLLVLTLPLALAYQVLLRAFITARLQNLFWSSTGNHHIRFGSRLRARALAAVMGRNWALMIVTLGLYFPFAQVAQARVRLQAVVLHTKVDLDALVARRGSGHDDAAGDAAADVLGFDIGL